MINAPPRYVTWTVSRVTVASTAVHRLHGNVAAAAAILSAVLGSSLDILARLRRPSTCDTRRPMVTHLRGPAAQFTVSCVATLGRRPRRAEAARGHPLGGLRTVSLSPLHPKRGARRPRCGLILRGSSRATSAGHRRCSGAFTWLHECVATSTRLACSSLTA